MTNCGTHDWATFSRWERTRALRIGCNAVRFVHDTYLWGWYRDLICLLAAAKQWAESNFSCDHPSKVPNVFFTVICPECSNSKKLILNSILRSPKNFVLSFTAEPQQGCVTPDAISGTPEFQISPRMLGGVPAKLLLKFPKNSISRLQISPCNTFRASSKKAVHHRFWIDFFPSWFSSCVVPFRTERCKNSHFPDDGLVTRACQSNYFVCSHRELKLMAEQVLRCREDQSKCDLLEYSNNFAFNGFSDVLNFYEIIFPFFVYLMSHLTQCWMRQFWYCGLIVAHIILKCFLFFIEGWPAQRNIPPSYPPGNIANHNILLDLRKGWAGLDQICK